MLKDRKDLSIEIESVMNQYNVTMMEAIIHICEIKNIEVEAVATLIKQSPKLKDILRKEATHLKMLNK